MTATTAPAGDTAVAAPTAPFELRTSTASAFGALLLRDLTVLRKNLKEFLPRTILQPLLLVFVFTYVFPKIGQGIGGAGTDESFFSTLLVAGVIGTAILFQGVQSVALPLVQEFGYTREIEDRVLAPLPVALVAIEKIVAGALQCLLAGLIVFPIATFVPASPVDLHVDWPILVTVIPLACLMSGALGLMFGTMFDPRTVPMLFGVIVVPITFLGCTYYSWQALEPIRWLQIAVLANPLVYISEGFRAALTDVPTMSLWAIYPVMVAFLALFTYQGVRGFTKRVIA
jgi:ABC-2 type transport system permease protein